MQIPLIIRWRSLFIAGISVLAVIQVQHALSLLSPIVRDGVNVALVSVWTLMLSLCSFQCWRVVRWAALTILFVLLTSCGSALEPAPTTPPIMVIPTPEMPLDSATAERWLTDGAFRLSAEPGHVRGVVAVLDERMHPHFVYQSSVEWMDSRNDGGVIVTGVTPGGDRYERRLWTATKGYATNGIGVRGDRIIVTAGVPQSAANGLTLLVWQSTDGGKTWGEPQEVPFAGRSYQADVAWTPDGRAVLVAGVTQSEQFQTQIAVEDPGQGWAIHTPFPSLRNGNYHTVWMRDAHDANQSLLPALVVLASRDGGFMVGRSNDGQVWETVDVESVTAYTPRLIAAGNALFALYHQYGRAGVWMARSDNGGATWQLGSAFTGLLESPTSGISVENAHFLWDDQSQRIFMLVARFDRGARHRRLVILSATRDQALNGDSAWSPAIVQNPWMPITLPAAHTDQIRPYAVQRGPIAIVGWEGWYVPLDPRTATEADFRSASEPNYAVIRVSQLAEAWQALQNRGAR